jgi:hypothetical protein
VLIDTDYEPFTVRPRPDGRVIYLRPRRSTTTSRPWPRPG